MTEATHAPETATGGPLETRSLFNEAFLAVILYRSVKAWHRERGQGMHTVLCYLVAPLALHGLTRAVIPSRKNAVMLEWVYRNPHCMSVVPQSCLSLKPFVSRSLVVAVRSGMLVPEHRGLVSIGKIKRRPRNLQFSAEVEDCFETAENIGKWFAQQDDVVSILAAWGVRP